MAETPQQQADQPTGNCPCCRKRDVEPPRLVCDACATRSRFRLRDLGELHAQLGDPVDVDDDWDGTAVLDDNQRPVKDRDGNVLHHHDPALPAGPLRGRSGQPHVSGTAEPSVPADLQALDLDGQVVRLGGIPVPDWRAVDPRELVPLMRIVHGPVRVWIGGELHQVPITRKEAVRNPAGRRILVPAVDEVGPLPIAVRLDAHVRRWVNLRRRREHRPVPTVPVLLAWLGARLDWALEHDPQLPDLDSDVRHMIAQIRGVLDLHDPEPERVQGVECRRCDAMSTLIRLVRDHYATECAACSDLMTPQEFDRWAGLLADRERHRLGRKGIKEVLRPKPLKPAEGAA
jgi:hypothetical protein